MLNKYIGITFERIFDKDIDKQRESALAREMTIDVGIFIFILLLPKFALIRKVSILRANIKIMIFSILFPPFYSHNL